MERPWPHSRLSMISLLETKPRSPHRRAELAGRGSASPPCHIEMQSCTSHASRWHSAAENVGANPGFSAGSCPQMEHSRAPQNSRRLLGLFYRSHACLRECTSPSCSGEPHPCCPGKGEQLCPPVKHHLLAEASEAFITEGAMGGVFSPVRDHHGQWQHPTNTLLRSPMGASPFFFFLF